MQKYRKVHSPLIILYERIQLYVIEVFTCNYFLRFGSMIELFILNYILIVNVIWLSARAKNVFADFQRNKSMLIQSQNFGANNAKQDTRIW